MASAAIKGLTVEIGGDTTKLGKALENVEKKSRNLSKELGEVNKLLKLDPGNAELLAQKQQILAEAVENTRDKLKTLKEAEAQVQEQFERGEVSVEQVRALQREIAATEQKLQGYERAVDETADEVARLGREAEDAAEEVEDTGDAADDAADDAEELESSLDGLVSNGFKAVAAAAAAATAAIVGCVESSYEYRREMGKLETAFETNNHSAEVAYETYAALQGVLGETDQAVEAANHLAKLADNQEDLAKWTEIATGVYATFGASLPIEGLTEAANETAKVGQVTGPLADALNWAADAGMNFGITLKENTDFVEKSAKELKKMTAAQRAEYEARKEQQKEIDAYNKRVKEAISAEDKFNIALENCTNEQERQKLITETLTEIYREAAGEYKKTNKQIIEANEATERWNKSMAKVGEAMAPVVTDVKNFGAEILDSMAEPMEDVAKYIRSELLPKLVSITDWVRNNGPTIKATLVAVTAALVAYKAATIAAEVAQKGLKGAIMATEAAQKLLNLVVAAGPWGLVATAVAGLTAAMVVFSKTAQESAEPVDVLTDEEKKLAEAADAAAESFREQQAATKEALGDITGEMDYVTSLKDELLKLADASGKVDATNRGRAEFILGQLNNALGTEYTMVDGVIQQYDELKTSVDAVIQSKLANSLLEASNAEYVAAIQDEKEAYANVKLKMQEYEAQKDVLAQKEAEYAAEVERLEQQILAARETGNAGAEAYLQTELGRKEEAIQAERNFVTDKKAAWDEASAHYKNLTDTIIDYEAAQEAAMEGNYDKTVDILTDKGQIFGDYAAVVDAETAKVLATLEKEAVDAGIKAEETKKNFEAGVEGYTLGMVREADRGYHDALAAFANAYDDSVPVGEDLTDGVVDGMENKRQSAISKIKSIVSGIIAAARKEADSHSPSRKMMDFGEDVTEGAEVGMKNRTKNLLDTARKQVDDLMGAYSDAGEDMGQTAFTNVSRQTATREAQAYQTALNGNADKLDKILAAIEKGQILTIDGKQLIGQTAAMYDNELGRRRALAARGAL